VADVMPVQIDFGQLLAIDPAMCTCASRFDAVGEENQ
jgi:hypothetical protein